MIEVVVNKGQMRALRHMLKTIPQDIPRVLARALNKIARATNTRILRGITKRYTITQRDLKDKNITLSKANYKTLRAVINIHGRRIRLLHFKAKQLKKGVSYKIRKSGRRKKVYAFMESPPGSGQPTMMPKTGHRGVFTRRGKKRLPIVELYGPSVPAIFQNLREFASTSFQRELGQKLGKEMQIQAGLLLKRKSRVTYAAA